MDLGLRKKYKKDHGAKLREERREFKLKEARSSADTGMAAVERRQIGETKRAGMQEAGLEARHKREFGRPDKVAGDPGGFRYAELAAAERGIKGKRAGATGGLTSMQDSALKESAFKNAQEQLETMLDPVTGKVMNKESGEPLSEKGIAGMRDKLMSDYYNYARGGEQQLTPMGDAPSQALGRGSVRASGGRTWGLDESMPFGQRITRGFPAGRGMAPPPEVERELGAGGVSPPPEAEVPPPPGVGGLESETAPGTPTIAEKGAAAARLREEYNKANPDPDLIEALKKQLGGLSRWMKGMMLSPAGSYTEAPMGLRGFNANR